MFNCRPEAAARTKSKKWSFFRKLPICNIFSYLHVIIVSNECQTIRIHFEKYSHTLFCSAKIVPALHCIPISLSVFAHNGANKSYKSWGVWGFFSSVLLTISYRFVFWLSDHAEYDCSSLLCIEQNFANKQINKTKNVFKLPKTV